MANDSESAPRILAEATDVPTHPCATSGFVKMCCPNLAVSNKWFFPPPLPEASALPSPPPDLFLFVGRLLALVGALITLRESRWDTALGMMAGGGLLLSVLIVVAIESIVSVEVDISV